MRNGIVAYVSNAVASTLAILVLLGWLSEEIAAGIVLAVGAWATLFVAVNDARRKP